MTKGNILKLKELLFAQLSDLLYTNNHNEMRIKTHEDIIKFNI